MSDELQQLRECVAVYRAALMHLMSQTGQREVQFTIDDVRATPPDMVLAVEVTAQGVVVSLASLRLVRARGFEDRSGLMNGKGN